MRYISCDNCGKEAPSPYHFEGDERGEAFEVRKDFVIITVEHNEDVLHFDACSWACCAEMALKRAADQATST